MEEKPNPIMEKKLKEVDERLDKKFESFSDQPIMMHIAELAKKYLKSKIKLS